MPPKSGRHDMAGPIDRFLAEVFRLAGAPVSEEDEDRRGLVIRLRNDIGPLREKLVSSSKLRLLLDPWLEQSEQVGEVLRLLQHGKADVLRVPTGGDQGAVPGLPAIIEFEETGTLCFWRPPIEHMSGTRHLCSAPLGHTTIAMEPALRSQIMQRAEHIVALNARDRHMRELRKSSRTARRAKAKAG
jgi:hypothetical protein